MSLIFTSLLSVVLPVVLIGLIVVVIVASRRGDAGEAVDPGIGTVRRIFLYGIGFVALIFAAVGVAMLVSGALDAAVGDLVIAESRTELAVALAFITVGIPAWAILMLVAQRTLRAHPVERRSQARRLYLDLARGVALAIVMFSAIAVGRFLVRVEEFEGGPWGWLLAWAAVWVVHDRLAAVERAETVATRLLDRLYGYFGAVLGLLVLLGGASATLIEPLEAAYNSTFREAFVQPAWTETWRTALVVAFIGAAVWVWHWLHTLAQRDARTTLWHTYLFLFGILGGVALSLIPASALLHAVLQWFLGEPAAINASAHFALLPVAASLLIVGLASWVYHRVVLMKATPELRRSEPERIYRYLLAAAGLLAVASAIATLGALLIDLATATQADLFRPEGWWRNRLVFIVTLLLVGIPVWAYHWYRTQQAIGSGGIEERNALSRRIYVFAVLGVATLTALVNLTIVLFRLFDALLEGTLGQAVIHDARWSIALVFTAAAIAVYHWLVLREDQQARDEVERATVVELAPPRPRSVIVIAGGERPDGIARALGEVPRVRVQTWRRLDRAQAPALSSGALAALREEIERSEHEHLVLLVDAEGYWLVPYADGPSAAGSA